MDKKDEIILQQLDVIRTMTQNNLNRMGSDFWGAPLTPDAPKSAVPKEAAPKANAPKSADGAKPNKPAASTGADEKKEEEAPLPPPEKIEDLKKELDTYIGLGEVKREVNNLINMATVFKRREETGLPNADFSLHMVFTGNPGKYVPVEKTIEGFRAIVDGEVDDLPEAAFFMVGDIDDAKAKAEAMRKG